MKKFKVFLTGLAKEDLKTAKKYYNNISPKLALQFILRIKEARIYIAENPLSNDISYINVRTNLVKQFPYQIHYLVNETEFTVIIIAIEFAKREDLNFSNRI